MEGSIGRGIASSLSILAGMGIAWFLFAAEVVSGTKILTFFGLWFGFVATCFFGGGLLMSDETIEAITATSGTVIRKHEIL